MLRVSLTLSTLLSIAGCGSDGGSHLSREQYIDLNVAILRARDAAPDSLAAPDSAKAVLSRYGAGEDDLREFAESLAEDPGALSLIWLEIENRLKTPPEADSTEASRRSNEGEEEEEE